MNSKIKNRLKDIIILLFFLVIAISISFFIYNQVEKTKETIEIPILNKDIEVGLQISENDLKYIEVSLYGLSNIIISNEQVIGGYALKDLQKNRVIYSEDISSDPMDEEQRLFEFGALAVSMDVIQSGGKLPQKNQWISIYIVIEEQVIKSEKLSKVKLIDIRNAKGKSLLDEANNHTKVTNEVPALAILDVDEEQQILLLEGEYKGELHLVLLPEEQYE